MRFDRRWGAAGGEQHVFAYKGDGHRVGHCPWRPSDGDYCVRVKHSGDYFHDYVAMRKGEDGLWRRVGEFGAYVFGESLGKMPDREFHLMMAGEPVSFDFEGAAERKRK